MKVYSCVAVDDENAKRVVVTLYGDAVVIGFDPILGLGQIHSGPVNQLNELVIEVGNVIYDNPKELT